jgi:shikimate kinase
MTQPIFLIGARGSGKTTVGQLLARARQYPFVDTDRWLQDAAQMTVATIVEQEGWEQFRARESQALEAVTQPETVIATGGGIVLAERNRQFMRQHGIVIYLSAPAETLAARLEAFPDEGLRPTLTGKPISEEVREVLEQRDALYRQAAHHIVDATRPADDVVSAIQILLRIADVSQGYTHSSTADKDTLCQQDLPIREKPESSPLKRA